VACELVGEGRDVIGVDPAVEMLGVARSRPRGDVVRWIEGDASSLTSLPPADLVVMTGHVVQVFLDDATFLATLRAARQILRDGGRLAFEDRDPNARAWESWTPERSHRRIEAAELGVVHLWHELLTSPTPNGLVRFREYYHFESTSELLTSESELRFRTEEETAALLREAGFPHQEWFGDWDRSPITGSTRELIVVAR
jgi:SAM-dependent methyltransferase